MEFINYLVENEASKKHREAMLASPYGLMFDSRILKHIKFNNGVGISIQASEGHYCTPRITTDFSNYTAMEFALFKDGEFTSVDKILENELLQKKLSEYYDTVYGFVPVELIEELFQNLKAEYGLFDS